VAPYPHPQDRDFRIRGVRGVAELPMSRFLPQPYANPGLDFRIREDERIL